MWRHTEADYDAKIQRRFWNSSHIVSLLCYNKDPPGHPINPSRDLNYLPYHHDNVNIETMRDLLQ